MSRLHRQPSQQQPPLVRSTHAQKKTQKSNHPRRRSFKENRLSHFFPKTWKFSWRTHFLNRTQMAEKGAGGQSSHTKERDETKQPNRGWGCPALACSRAPPARPELPQWTTDAEFFGGCRSIFFLERQICFGPEASEAQIFGKLGLRRIG